MLMMPLVLPLTPIQRRNTHQMHQMVHKPHIIPPLCCRRLPAIVAVVVVFCVCTSVFCLSLSLFSPAAPLTRCTAQPAMTSTTDDDLATRPIAITYINIIFSTSVRQNKWGCARLHRHDCTFRSSILHRRSRLLPVATDASSIHIVLLRIASIT